MLNNGVPKHIVNEAFQGAANRWKGYFVRIVQFPIYAACAAPGVVLAFTQKSANCGGDLSIKIGVTALLALLLGIFGGGVIAGLILRHLPISNSLRKTLFIDSFADYRAAAFSSGFAKVTNAEFTITPSLQTYERAFNANAQRWMVRAFLVLAAATATAYFLIPEHLCGFGTS